MLERETHQRVRTPKAELLTDVRAMGVDGSPADGQFVGNLSARQVLADQLDDATLRGRQRLDPGLPTRIRAMPGPLAEKGRELRARKMSIRNDSAKTRDDVAHGG